MKRRRARDLSRFSNSGEAAPEQVPGPLTS
jgi:hypothetical protein